MAQIDVKEIPDKFHYLNEDGSFSNKINENQKLSMTQYWGNHYQEIGAIMLISAIIFLGVLLNETDLLNLVWNGALDLIGSFFAGVF